MSQVKNVKADDSRSSKRTRLDPKIRARRISVRRNAGRRRLRILVGLVAGLALVMGSIAFANSSWFDVDSIVVEGVDKLTEGDVREVAGIFEGQQLTDVDVASARQAVAALPWSANVSVGRSLSGQVTISVDERSPVIALPAEGGKFVLVDSSGRQLGEVGDASDEFIPVSGLTLKLRPGQPVSLVGQRVIRVADSLTPVVEDAVAAISVESDELFLDLAEGGRVALGDASRLDEKLLAVETLLMKVDFRCLGVADVRVPSAPAITRVNVDGVPQETLVDLDQCG